MNPVVEVKQGKLQGSVQKSVLTGNEYYSFRGIPFAKPPINDLRFQVIISVIRLIYDYCNKIIEDYNETMKVEGEIKFLTLTSDIVEEIPLSRIHTAPVPLEKWDGILDATKDGMSCTQTDMISGALCGSEDCLFINVYTPSLPSGKPSLKPVMVFIHGGGFYAGNGSSLEYAPDFLINYDVLFVTTNYRLHALGFLNMGTKNDVPNCGLRDQILALKWIKENIQQFGGDPENITIFGESAGASSVHYHMISPLSKGLFHKAILQSGTFNCPWSLKSEPEKSGQLLAKKLGYKGDEDGEKVVEFLKTQTAEKIALAVKEIQEGRRLENPCKAASIFFLPSIEANKQNAVIPDHPEILMKTADPVPLIVGFNDKEGRLAFMATPEKLIETLRQDFATCIRHNIQADKEQISSICSKIKQFYFGEKEIGQDIGAIVDLYTDILFKNFYESFENITNSKHPVYVYEFGFNGRFNIYSKAMMKDPTISTGAAHADELPYIFFKPAFQKTEFVEPELTVIKNMCSMWSNFARTGNPTQGMKIEWRPHTTNTPCHLRIDNDLKLVQEKITQRRIDFWKNIRATKSS